MKKVALIVLLAVIASRVLSERDARPDRPDGHHVVVVRENGSLPPQPPAPPHYALDRSNYYPTPPQEQGQTIRTIPWHGGPSRDMDPTAPKPKSKRTAGKKPLATPAASPQSKEIPSWFPQTEMDEERLAQSDASGFRVLLGRLSASEERARADLRQLIRREISDWLAADVATAWTPPEKLVDRMIWATRVQPVTWSLGAKTGEQSAPTPAPETSAALEIEPMYTLYRAGQKLDFSDARRAEFVRHYQRDVASARMKRSGSVIAVVLASLALFSLYIRTDEATKGYYTNRLRVLALGGLGVAGTVAYHYWS